MDAPPSHHEEEDDDDQLFLDESDIIEEVPFDEEGPSSLSTYVYMFIHIYIYK